MAEEEPPEDVDNLKSGPFSVLYKAVAVRFSRRFAAACLFRLGWTNFSWWSIAEKRELVIQEWRGFHRNIMRS